MRFSLMTLLLLALWVGAGMGVWFRREAWVLERHDAVAASFSGWAVHETFVKWPDGRRYLTTGISGSVALNPFLNRVVDARTNQTIYEFGERLTWVGEVEVNSDDSFQVLAWSDQGYGPAHYRRRFPEWWWGHFYRPEVWAFALLSVVLIVRGIQALRRRRLARAV